MKRYLVKTGAEMTWQEIADELGVTEFAVRQTYARAMRKLRRRCRRIGYDLHDIVGRCDGNLARAEMWS